MSLENKSLAELEKARFGPAHANSAQSESFHDGKSGIGRCRRMDKVTQKRSEA